MIVVPALDVRDGACVQLRGGDYDDELLRLEDPVAVATSWRDDGFRALHVVDLDAATERGDNRGVIEAICAIDGLEVRVGGGVRSTPDVERLLAAGAAVVIVGTRGIDDRDWLAEVASTHPGSIAMAVDVRGGVVTTRGWRHTTDLDPAVVLGHLEALALALVLVTAVDVEGRQQGPDLELVARLRAATSHRLGVAGGIARRADLDALADLGVDDAVVGTALYTGALAIEGLNQEPRP